jgi:hypothetical protein
MPKIIKLERIFTVLNKPMAKLKTLNNLHTSKFWSSRTSIIIEKAPEMVFFILTIFIAFKLEGMVIVLIIIVALVGSMGLFL